MTPIPDWVLDRIAVIRDQLEDEHSRSIRVRNCEARFLCNKTLSAQPERRHLANQVRRLLVCAPSKQHRSEVRRLLRTRTKATLHLGCTFSDHGVRTATYQALDRKGYSVGIATIEAGRVIRFIHVMPPRAWATFVSEALEHFKTL